RLRIGLRVGSGLFPVVPAKCLAVSWGVSDACVRETVVLVAENLKKRYGAVAAVDDLSFEVRPGVVTGFLGPNGSGKSTTMRLFLGLDRPTAGRATVSGRSYVDLPAPLPAV